MPANPTYNDGSLQYGSAVLTIDPVAAGDNFDVIADPEFTFSGNSRRVLQTNQFAEPLKKFGIPELREGSCTVQLPTDKRIYRGDTFTTDVTTGVTTWIVEGADHPFEKEGYRKQTIRYAEKLN